MVGAFGEGVGRILQDRLRVPAMFLVRFVLSIAHLVVVDAPALIAEIPSFVRNLPTLFKMVVRYNVRNLFVRWRITLLTALAFTLVIGLLTVMLAFVNGMARLTEASGQAGNVIVLSEGANDEVFSNMAF